ncbi:MAG: hypothetical protein IPM74_05420 [Crocinitomicaceae bacterium]|nr:hypothetical protein [Crocinitomicaceae bacterium]MBK8925343.1 hypothetical protein [Crocinitomicaceae bacterium]
MKLIKISALAIISLGFFACGNSSDANSTSTTSTTESTSDETTETSGSSDFRTVSTNSYFDIDIPGHMEAASGLNGDASIQYQYVEQVGTTVKEHYVIVLMETKEEIESYDLDEEFDALSYGEISSTSLGDGLDSFEILTKNPEVVQVNGLDCVKYEMEGSMGEVNVYYRLGVFEGEKAFYQVLTWTLTEQKAEFKADMDKIINSFKEK